MYIKKKYKHLNCRKCEGVSSQGCLSVEQCLGAIGELKWELFPLVILHGEDFQSSSFVKFGNPQSKATTWHFLKLMLHVVK